MKESPVERLAQTHPDLEIWWDSSPLVYSHWVQKMLSTAEEPSRKSLLKEQLAKLYNDEMASMSIFRGCTTNPPLSWGPGPSNTEAEGEKEEYGTWRYFDPPLRPAQ